MSIPLSLYTKCMANIKTNLGIQEQVHGQRHAYSLEYIAKDEYSYIHCHLIY